MLWTPRRMQRSDPGRLCRGTESGALKKPVSYACTACPAGHYGAACLLKCSCQNNGTCEPTTGTCHCGPGFYGRACEHCEWGCPLTLDTLSRLVLVLRAMAAFSVSVLGERWAEPDQALGWRCLLRVTQDRWKMGSQASSLCLSCEPWLGCWLMVGARKEGD